MNSGTSLLLGFTFLALGGLLWIAVRIALRQVVPKPTGEIPDLERNSYPDSSEHSEGVLVVGHGGKIISLNQAGIQLFGLRADESYSFETLSQKIRPVDALFDVCGTPSERQINLNGQVVEVSSYAIGIGMLVSFRHPNSETKVKSQLSNSISLDVITKFTQLTAANLDLEDALESIFKEISGLVPNDFIEIAIWDNELEVLIPYRFGLNPNDKIVKGEERYRIGESFSGLMVKTHQPLYIEDIPSYHQIQFEGYENQYSLNSFMGFPLILDHEVIGTLGIGSVKSSAFQDEDKELIMHISVQVAAIIHNAQLFKVEKLRTKELSALAQLSQSFSITHDPEKIFSRMLSIIGSMVPVEILGFLLFNQSSNMLEAQKPFKGLPDQFVEIFKSAITEGSDAKKLIDAQDVLITDSAIEDSHWRSLGLSHVARAASMRKTVLVPLISGGNSLGYLLASNHIHGNTGFSQEEMNLIMIVANQAAPLIENIYLISQSNQRAQKAEILQHIAMLTSTNSDPGEILSYGVKEMVQILNADFAAVFLLDSDGVELGLDNDSLFISDSGLTTEIKGMLVDDPRFESTMTCSKSTLVIGQFNETNPVAPFYQNLLDTLKLQSAVIVPLLLRDGCIGEIIFGSNQLSCFDQGDVQEITPIANELAKAIEQVQRLNLTDEGLRKQVNQLSFISRLTQELTASINLENLLELLLEESKNISKADSGTVYLFENEENTVESPRVIHEIGEFFDKDFSDAEYHLLKSGNPILISAGRPEPGISLPEKIQSAIILPFQIRNKYYGLLYLFCQADEGFNEDILNAVNLLITQFCRTIDKSLQLEEHKQYRELLEKKLENQKKLFEISEVLRPGQPFNVAMDAIAMAIMEVTPFKVVLISIYDPAIQALRRYTAKGIDAETWKELQFRTQPWVPLSKLLKPEYKKNNVFFIPQENAPDIPEGVHSVSTFIESEEELENKWRSDDICLVPLYDLIGEPLGLISVDHPDNGLRPDDADLEALDLFSIQAGLLIENNRSNIEIRERLANLTDSNNKLKEALDASQANVPGLIQKHLEQKEENQNLSQELRKIQSIFDTAVLAARQSDRLSVVTTVAKELISNFGLQYGLIAEKNENEFLKLQKVIGEPPEDIHLEALLGQTNPIYSVLQTQKTLWANDGDIDSDWSSSPLLKAFNARYFIAVPFVLSVNKNLVLLMISNQPVGYIDGKDKSRVEELTEQLNAILKKQIVIEDTKHHLEQVVHLLNFSRKLGNLNLQEILESLLETSLDYVIPAQAGWVGIWNEQYSYLEPQTAKGYLYKNKLLSIRFESDEKSLPVNVFSTKQPEIVNKVEFPICYPLNSEKLIQYKEATGGRLPLANLAVPLFVSENGLGVIVLENFDEDSVFTKDDENMVFSLAQQAAFAMQNAYLLQAIKKRSDQLQSMTDVSGTIGSSLHTSDLVGSLLDQLRQVVDYDTATLWLLRNDKLRIESVNGFNDAENRIGISTDVRDSSLFQEMKSKNEIISIADIRADKRFSLMVEPKYLSWLGIPIITKSKLIGMIALEKKTAGFYDADTIKIANKFASQVSSAMENAGLFEDTVKRSIELDEQSNRLATLNQFSSDVTEKLDLSHIIKLTLKQVSASLHCDSTSLIMIEKDRILFKGHFPEIAPQIQQDFGLNPLLLRLKESQGVYYVNEVSEDKDLADFYSKYFQLRTARSVLFIPLVFSTNVIGWMLLESKQRRRFLPEEIELAQTFANQSAVAVQNARLLEETRILTEELKNSPGNMNKDRERQDETLQSNEILEAVADGVLVTDSENKITLFNKAASKIAGLNPNQLKELDFEQLKVIFGNSVSNWLETIQNWTEQADKIQKNENFIDQITLENNRVISINLAPVFHGKEFLGTVSVFRDVTLESQVDQFKSDFVANVSHELRTPLTAIKGYADIMLMGAAGKISDQQRKFLEIIHTHTERLNILVGDLLDVSSIETGRLKLELKPLDLIGMSERVLTNIRIRSEEDKKPMILHLDAPEELPSIEGDPNRVFQILDNLVSNSYSYTAEKGTILIKLREKTHMIQVDVQDTGIGIPDRIKDRIFERFYRGDDPKILSTSGTGLGLAVSKTLIEMHGGKIWFESSGIPGEGSIFSFTLPIYQR